MDSTASLEAKYQNLAAEYSKLRANATVLKKAVLDEQARSRELKESLKEHEQKLRKSNQEMESLMFRNQQLTKRISVLQQELAAKPNNKKTKGKFTENVVVHPANMTLLDEELQKKIMDNAQLISAMADKDFEISSLHERVSELEGRVLCEQKEKSEMLDKHRAEVRELQAQQGRLLKESEARLACAVGGGGQNGDACSDRGSTLSSEEGAGDAHPALAGCKQQVLLLEQQLERCRAELQLQLLAGQHAPQDSDEQPAQAQQTEQVKEYLYERVDGAVALQQHFRSMAGSLASECSALQLRLELCLQEKGDAESKLEASERVAGRLQEELATTSYNYEQQLSTMSEHLADLNDKYTEQCEQLQQLHYQLGQRPRKPAK